MASFSEIVATTIDEYLREEVVNVYRKRKLLAALNEKGCITFNHSGDNLTWVVRDTRSSISTIEDVPALQFGRTRKHRQATLPYRGYAATDSYTKLEELKNRGEAAIIKYVSDKAKVLMGDMRDAFTERLYYDGNAAATSEDIHGLQSFVSTSGASGNGYIGLPNDTYAGLVCTHGNYGGTWTGSYPSGTGDAQYDFWAPLVVDTTDTLWADSTKDFANNAIEQLRYGLTHQNVRTNGECDIIFLEKTMYNNYKDAQDSKERIVSNRSMENSTMIKLGFTDVQNFDGSDVTTEQGIPADQGYGLTLDKECIELCAMGKQLFVSEVPDFDISSFSKRLAIWFYGNLRCNPRDVIQWAAVT